MLLGRYSAAATAPSPSLAIAKEVAREFGETVVSDVTHLPIPLVNPRRLVSGTVAPNSAARFQQYKVLRAEGLNATDAYAVLSRKYVTRPLADGTVVTTLGRSAIWRKHRLLDDRVLFVDSTSVAQPLRGQGISHELFERTLSQVGPQNVRSIQSYLSNTNLDVVRVGIERGLTPSQAAALTPRGRTAIKNGFTNISYDPFTGIFNATR